MENKNSKNIYSRPLKICVCLAYIFTSIIHFYDMLFFYLLTFRRRCYASSLEDISQLTLKYIVEIKTIDFNTQQDICWETTTRLQQTHRPKHNQIWKNFTLRTKYLSNAGHRNTCIMKRPKTSKQKPTTFCFQSFFFLSLSFMRWGVHFRVYIQGFKGQNDKTNSFDKIQCVKWKHKFVV